MLDERARLTDQALNVAIATAMGYTYAGPFRGHPMYHPPGLRTAVVREPDYVHDWNALMPLVLGCWGRLSAGRSVCGMDIREVFCAVDAQRLLCEAVLADMGQQGRAQDVASRAD